MFANFRVATGISGVAWKIIGISLPCRDNGGGKTDHLATTVDVAVSMISGSRILNA